MLRMKLAQSCVFKFLSMEAVLTFEEDLLESNLQVYGLTGWADKVKETIQSLTGLRRLPSPSDMKPSDISRILLGELPMPSKGFSVKDDLSVDDYMARFNKYFRNESEMEAMARVVRFLHLAFEKSKVDNIYVHLQPSIMGHSTFTDALILIKDSNKTPKAIIAVKKAELSCSLSVETKQVAQVLREAHILLCDSDFKINMLPIVLTNSVSWSFGLVRKSYYKIVLEKTMDLHLEL